MAPDKGREKCKGVICHDAQENNVPKILRFESHVNGVHHVLVVHGDQLHTSMCRDAAYCTERTTCLKDT